MYVEISLSPIRVFATSRYCIHLQVTSNSPSARYLSIVYASPDASQRELDWQELRDFKLINEGPRVLAGDFNVVTFDREKIGGGLANPSSRSSFNNCIQDCNLLDLGFAGPLFTWSIGDLRERLDIVLSNETWLSMFHDYSVTHLPIPTFDHCGLWLKTTRNGNSRNNLKLLGSWFDHPDFSN